MQLFLAMPAACPQNPDGSKRTVPSEDEVKHVTLFQSNDAGKDFEQVRPGPLSGAPANSALASALRRRASDRRPLLLRFRSSCAPPCSRA